MSSDLRVALLSRAATSVISTIKVDWPEARSSLAPIRVNTRSTTPTRAERAGTKEPIWAMRTIRATWRM